MPRFLDFWELVEYYISWTSSWVKQQVVPLSVAFSIFLSSNIPLIVKYLYFINLTSWPSASLLADVNELLHPIKCSFAYHLMINSLRAAGGRVNGEGARKTRTRERPRAVPAPEANAELQANIDVCAFFWLISVAHLFICMIRHNQKHTPRTMLSSQLTRSYNLQKRRLITHANAKSKSEKFPPPHQDGALGYPLGCSNHMEPAFEPPDPSSFSTVFPYEKGSVPTWSGPLADPSSGNQKRKHKSGRSSKQPATARARWSIIWCLVHKKSSILKRKKNTGSGSCKVRQFNCKSRQATMNFFLLDPWIHSM